MRKKKWNSWKKDFDQCFCIGIRAEVNGTVCSNEHDCCFLFLLSVAIVTPRAMLCHFDVHFRLLHSSGVAHTFSIHSIGRNGAFATNHTKYVPEIGWLAPINVCLCYCCCSWLCFCAVRVLVCVSMVCCEGRAVLRWNLCVWKWIFSHWRWIANQPAAQKGWHSLVVCSNTGVCISTHAEHTQQFNDRLTWSAHFHLRLNYIESSI